MFVVLTREQRGRWNGPVLSQAVLKEYASLKLDAAQKGKIAELCRTRGEGVSAPVDPLRHDATFKAVKQQACATVLTPAQRKEYAGHKRPAGASGSNGRLAPLRTTDARFTERWGIPIWRGRLPTPRRGDLSQRGA